MDQSRFWQRLDELSGAANRKIRKRAIDHLKASIRKVTEQAKWIGTQVCRFMPQYTLHEERHFLNVLAIMDALVPDEVVRQLGALDCGLPILAAYTHDLGMALSQEEYDRLQDESTERGKHLASYRTRFDEELRQLERWKKRGEELAGNTDAESQREAAAARKRVESIEGHILASYLRETHTEDDQVRRLRGWLDLIKQETGDENVFRYGVGGKDYQRELALIGVSHGRGAPWLRRQLIDGGPDARFFEPVGTGESANLAFPGLLLRLADVMDFDASRAPRILFKHFGIENDQSVLEWNKHLSIVGWRLDVDPDGKQQPDLLYSAECQHPVHEKAIREFKTWINAELSAVRIELDAQRRQLPAAAQPRYDLHLPSQTRLDIRPARDPLTDQPKYVYHDLQFRLDQYEIQQLLMGESLYGDPGLCIRELLQNALDALELRELRLKMKQKGEAREPVDGELIRPGWVREPDGREEELRVTLDWGTDEETGQQWLRVTDNGVGMTEEVIKNYFTQIGKSYYRSPEFNQERAAMKAAGEVVSPISTFGIGILSSFMIADRIHVRTCAGNTITDKSRMCDVMISGPGSLFWLRSGTLLQQGTEVTLYVKGGFQIEHDATDFLRAVKKHLRYLKTPLDAIGRAGEERPSHIIDPPFVAASTVVWPMFPVIVICDSNSDLRIDASFFGNVLGRLDSDSVTTVARTWRCDAHRIGQLHWHTFDWRDDSGEDATGSRVRFWFPTNVHEQGEALIPRDQLGQSDLCSHVELNALVEPVLEYMRERITVRGIHIGDGNPIEAEQRAVRPETGTRIWIDLRGRAAPRLSVDRQKTIRPVDADEWRREVAGVFRRLRERIAALLNAKPASQLTAFFAGFSFLPPIEPIVADKDGPRDFDLVRSCTPSWVSPTDPDSVEVAADWLLQQLTQHRTFRTEHEDDEYVPIVRVFLKKGNVYEHLFVRDSQLKLSLGGGLQLGRNRNINREASRQLTRVLAIKLRDTDTGARSLARDLSTRFEKEWCSIESSVLQSIEYCFRTAIIQEAFHPDLGTSWPPLGLYCLRGMISDATLSAPGIVEFAFEEDERTVHFADSHGKTPTELVQRGYDLTFPMTAVPLGQLRRECGEWRSGRWASRRSS